MDHRLLIPLALGFLAPEYFGDYLQTIIRELARRNDLTEDQKQIIQKLLLQALSKGVIQDHTFGVTSRKASGGVATELVTLNNAHIRFAIKIDKSEKLVREAMILEYMGYRPELPKGFANHFPKVYAVKKDKPPYAYIMQAFEGTSFAEHIFKKKHDVKLLKKTMFAILKILIPAYKSSRNDTLLPNIRKLYVERIGERLAAARAANKEFADFSTKPVTINGDKFETPEHYLDIIEKNIDRFSASFSTFVHGDCHLGNIIVNYIKENNKVKTEVKFIDTRDWYESDYIFDIAKIAQYLKVAGPAEATNKLVKVTRDAAKGTISYALNGYTQDVYGLLQIVRRKVLEFAVEAKDTNWYLRYQLAVASVLLGLHINRVKTTDKNKLDVSFIMYCEGLRYLADAASLKTK
jgi:hypothetical protein